MLAMCLVNKNSSIAVLCNLSGNASLGVVCPIFQVLPLGVPVQTLHRSQCTEMAEEFQRPHGQVARWIEIRL